MTIDEMKARKRELGLTSEELSRRSGVPVGTLRKIFSGATKNPRSETILQMEKVLVKNEGDTAAYASGLKRFGPCDSEEKPETMLRESGFYASPEANTYREYRSLPDDVRTELLYGHFVALSSPSVRHQLISMELANRLMNFVKDRKGACRVLTAPLDVRILKDEYTCVQPDLMILCDRKLLTENAVFGAPDFVAEILSPGSRKMDIGEKTALYRRAGVREYWIIDPDKAQVLVWIFEGEAEFPAIYGKNAEIPVHIWNDECRVNFSGIFGEEV